MISFIKETVNKYNKARARKKLIKKNKPHNHTLTLRDILKQYISSKITKSSKKESATDQNISMMPSGKVNHIAIVLDGRVEDVIRAQNQMTALLLNEPTFVVFDPNDVYPTLGVTSYADGKFFNPGQDHARPPEKNNHNHGNDEDHVHDESCNPDPAEITDETKRILNEAI
jgi:hypothetical protein